MGPLVGATAPHHWGCCKLERTHEPSFGGDMANLENPDRGTERIQEVIRTAAAPTSLQEGRERTSASLEARPIPLTPRIILTGNKPSIAPPAGATVAPVEATVPNSSPKS